MGIPPFPSNPRPHAHSSPHPTPHPTLPPAPGFVGTSLSNGLLLLRQKLDPTYIPQVRGGAGAGARGQRPWNPLYDQPPVWRCMSSSVAVTSGSCASLLETRPLFGKLQGWMKEAGWLPRQLEGGSGAEGGKGV